jgi:hypothetical protein
MRGETGDRQGMGGAPGGPSPRGEGPWGCGSSIGTPAALKAEVRFLECEAHLSAGFFPQKKAYIADLRHMTSTVTVLLP